MSDRTAAIMTLVPLTVGWKARQAIESEVAAMETDLMQQAAEVERQRAKAKMSTADDSGGVPFMWLHDCRHEGRVWVGVGQPCSWCGASARAEPERNHAVGQDSVRAAAERMVQTYRDWMAGCDNGAKTKDVEAAHINLRDALNRDSSQYSPDAVLDHIADHGVDFSLDGDKVCATFGDHIDLQSSPAGFGESNREALRALIVEWGHAQVRVEEPK